MELESAKVGEADLGRFAVIDGTGTPADPTEAIVPILKDINGYVQLIGTGFFITNTGLIATAKHVLMDVLDDTGKQIQNQNGVKPEEPEWCQVYTACCLNPFCSARLI
jgi:hypothetical protein